MLLMLPELRSLHPFHVSEVDRHDVSPNLKPHLIRRQIRDDSDRPEIAFLIWSEHASASAATLVQKGALGST